MVFNLIVHYNVTCLRQTFFKLAILIKKVQDLYKVILLVTVRRGMASGYLEV